MYRYAEVRVGGAWERREFAELKAGDVFRLFEPDGRPVNDGRAALAVTAPTACEPPGNMDVHAHFVADDALDRVAGGA